MLASGTARAGFSPGCTGNSIQWTLSDVALVSGESVAGAFLYNPVCGEVAEVDVRVSGGASLLARHYTTCGPSCSANRIVLFPGGDGDASGRRALVLEPWSGSFGFAAPSRALNTVTSGEVTCTNAACSSSFFKRAVTSGTATGTLVPTPEPTLVNASFEAQTTFEFAWQGSTTVESWDTTGVVALWRPGGSTLGGQPNQIPDGLNVIAANSGTLSQTVAEPIEAGKRYRLSVAAGSRSSGAAFGGGTIGLYAGDGEVLAQTTLLAPATPGGFLTAVAEFAAGSEHAGRTLVVRLTSAGVQTLFDDVRLDVLPEPSPRTGDVDFSGASPDAALSFSYSDFGSFTVRENSTGASASDGYAIQGPVSGTSVTVEGAGFWDAGTRELILGDGLVVRASLAHPPLVDQMDFDFLSFDVFIDLVFDVRITQLVLTVGGDRRIAFGTPDASGRMRAGVPLTVDSVSDGRLIATTSANTAPTTVETESLGLAAPNQALSATVDVWLDTEGMPERMELGVATVIDETESVFEDLDGATLTGTGTQRITDFVVRAPMAVRVVPAVETPSAAVPFPPVVVMVLFVAVATVVVRYAARRVTLRTSG